MKVEQSIGIVTRPHLQPLSNPSHRQWTGDGVFVARVESIEDTHDWAKVGIMVRAEPTSASPHAMVALSPQKGAVFLRRPEPGEKTYDDAHHAMRMVDEEGHVTFQQRGFAGERNPAKDAITDVSAPRWVKIVRRGDVFSAYDSSDGMRWEWLGTDRIPMGEAVSVGLAVSSHNNAERCRAVFDRIQFRKPEGNKPAAHKIGNGDGLRGSYFAQRRLKGKVMERVDARLDFDWGYEAPAEGMPSDRFSVRWEGLLEPKVSGPHMLQVASDDRARLWLNGHLMIDEWHGEPNSPSSALVQLEAGRRYLLRVDFFENKGRAEARLFWSTPTIPKEVIPQSQLYSEVPDSDGDGLPDLWEATYGLAPNSPGNAKADPNKDGISNLKAYRRGIHPRGKRTKSEAISGKWQSRDIGRVGQAGEASGDGSDFTIKGAGADIWAVADGFHYAYQTWQGDGTIVAEVTGIENTSPWAKAGVMIRKNLRPSSPHAMMTVTPEQGIQFLYRQERLANTTAEAGDSFPSSAWLKLVKRGNHIAGYSSLDGERWQWVGTIELRLGQELYVGLVVSSHNNSALAEAGFESVSLESEVPSQAASPFVGSGNGLSATYYEGGDSEKTHSRTDERVNFDWQREAPLSEFARDHFSVRWSGTLVPQYDEVYRLHLISDDGARLWLNNRLLIDDWSLSAAVPNTRQVELEAGKEYALRLEYFESEREAVARLLWSSPSTPKQPIPTSQLYSREPGRPGSSGSVKISETSDRDGSQGQASSTMETESLSARGERLERFPEAEVDGFETVDQASSGDIVDMLGEWAQDGSRLYAVDRRGYVEYAVKAPETGMYRIEVEADAYREHWSKRYELRLSIDGEFLKRASFNAARQGPHLVHAISPWVEKGSHRVRIYWDNARAARSLALHGVRLQAIRGADSNDNAVTDWVENRLVTQNGIKIAPGASRVSPVCLEGRSRFLSMMEVKADGQSVGPHYGSQDRWYADVPLSQRKAIAVDLAFENGGLNQSHAIEWEPTNLLAAGNVTLREGDALLLTAHPSGQPGEIEIQVDDKPVSNSIVGEPIAYRFNEAGAHTVQGRYIAPDGTEESRSIQVNVVSRDAFGQTPAAWVGKTREWTVPQLPEEAVLEARSPLRLEEIRRNASSEKTGSRYRLLTRTPETSHIVARLGEDGPVLANVPVQGFRLFAAGETVMMVTRKHPDGTQDIAMDVVLSPLRSQVTVQLEAIVGGVTFIDGTRRYDLVYEDFNALGEGTVEFSRSPVAETSSCHITRAFQGPVLLGAH